MAGAFFFFVRPGFHHAMSMVFAIPVVRSPPCCAMPYAGEPGKQSEGEQLAGSGQIILQSTLWHVGRGFRVGKVAATCKVANRWYCTATRTGLGLNSTAKQKQNGNKKKYIHIVLVLTILSLSQFKQWIKYCWSLLKKTRKLLLICSSLIVVLQCNLKRWQSRKGREWSQKNTCRNHACTALE